MTHNSIHRHLVTTRNPGPADPQPAPANAPTALSGGGSGISAMDPAALRHAAKAAPDVEDRIRAGCTSFPPETDKAAAALGSGWTTAAEMKKISAEWLQALRRLADEIDYLGSAVGKCADTRQWAEAESQKRIAHIRTGT